MNNPGFQFKQMWVVGVSCIALAGTLHAQPPTNSSDPRGAKTQRTRPQVIYHVKPASNYAATLHSQEKTQNNDLPVDNGVPNSLQRSRENANAPGAEIRPRQEAAAQQPQVKRPPKAQKKQMARPPMSMKSHGHGKGHKH
jgi:hypothetical protein